MDTKTKIFWWVMGFLIVASFGVTYYRYMVKKDYIVQAQVDCDPYSETCFVWNCDLESDEEGEMCTGDPEVDTWYYKIINKNANQISSCDASDENCDALVCAQNEPNCEFVFCNEENREEYYSETCTNPGEYTLANPVEEECEEGDEACLSGEDLDEELSEEEIIIQTTDDEILAEDNELVEEGEEPAGELPIAE